MSRRTFVGSAAALAAAWTGIAGAQPARVARIGFLGNGNASTGASQLEAFQQGLRELGWTEGPTLAMEYRWAEGRPERLEAILGELVKAKVDVIVLSGPLAIAASQRVTRTVPVVFVLLVDPVAMGFVRSLARPGGNMTGLASQFEALIAKQLQMLKEAVAGLSRVALLRHSEATASILAAAETAARSLGLVARVLTVAGEADFQGAFKAARSERVGAIHVLPSPYLAAHRARLIELASRYRLPAFYELATYVEDGGLMSYGPSLADLYGRTASYVDRILKGAHPGDLAIERPSRFLLVINQRTAAAIGLTIPESLLRQADRLIQ